MHLLSKLRKLYSTAELPSINMHPSFEEMWNHSYSVGYSRALYYKACHVILIFIAARDHGQR